MNNKEVKKPINNLCTLSSEDKPQNNNSQPKHKTQTKIINVFVLEKKDVDQTCRIISVCNEITT